MSNGNNREIPFVGVASVVNYDETVPMSANRVQFLKTSTKIVNILECPFFYCLIVAPACDRGFKTRNKPKVKALFNPANVCKTYFIYMYFTWIIFYTNCILKSSERNLIKKINWMFWDLTIAIRVNVVVHPGYTIHTYYRTTATRTCCAPGRIDCAPGLK